jgi:hypothetical protein
MDYISNVNSILLAANNKNLNELSFSFNSNHLIYNNEVCMFRR